MRFESYGPHLVLTENPEQDTTVARFLGPPPFDDQFKILVGLLRPHIAIGDSRAPDHPVPYLPYVCRVYLVAQTERPVVDVFAVEQRDGPGFLNKFVCADIGLFSDPCALDVGGVVAICACINSGAAWAKPQVAIVEIDEHGICHHIPLAQWLSHIGVATEAIEDVVMAGLRLTILR